MVLFTSEISIRDSLCIERERSKWTKKIILIMMINNKNLYLVDANKKGTSKVGKNKGRQKWTMKDQRKVRDRKNTPTKSEFHEIDNVIIQYPFFI